MAIFEITKDALVELPATTLAEQGIRERYDLQRLLRENIQAIAPDTLVLAEEYGEWTEARRRIDLLCLDKQANIIVVELKRTEDGGHMELQAIRYAAMVSTMTFDQAVEAHTTYLVEIGRTGVDAQSSILKFLDWDEPRKNEFAQDTRIILVSGEFSKEITTSVLWLNQRDLDIRCVRLRPHKVDAGRTFLDIQQVIPLPEAAEYQIQVRKKASEERQSQEGGSDWTRYDLNIKGQVHARQYKRGLFLQIVTALVRYGISLADIMKIIPERKFLTIPGRRSAEQFRAAASEMTKANGSGYDLDRYFAGEGELLYDEKYTYALSNQWSKKRLPWLDELIAKYPDAGISYSKSKDELE